MRRRRRSLFIVSDVFQASTKAPHLPEQLAFFVHLDATDDWVELETVDFKCEEKTKLKIAINAEVIVKAQGLSIFV